MRLLITMLTIATAFSTASEAVSLKTATATFNIDGNGSLVTIDSNTYNYLTTGQPAPLLQVRLAGKWLTPQSTSWDAKAGR